MQIDDAALYGEIVHIGVDGGPMFYYLMRRCSPQRFYAFDLLWSGRGLVGED